VLTQEAGAEDDAEQADGRVDEKDQPPEAAIDQPATENGAEGRGNDGGDAEET
jgi:hypothetical protein